MPLNAMLAADAIASGAPGAAWVAHPNGSVRVCAHDENGTAACLDAALKVFGVGTFLVIRPAAVRGVRTQEENGKWSLCWVSSD